jgi:hypothetical protein
MTTTNASRRKDGDTGKTMSTVSEWRRNVSKKKPDLRTVVERSSSDKGI